MADTAKAQKNTCSTGLGRFNLDIPANGVFALFLIRPSGWVTFRCKSTANSDCEPFRCSTVRNSLNSTSFALQPAAPSTVLANLPPLKS